MMTTCVCADWPRIARVSSKHAQSISFGGNLSVGIHWSMFFFFFFFSILCRAAFNAAYSHTGGLPPLENAFTHVCDNCEITSKTCGKNEEQASNDSSKLPRAAQLQTTREKKRGN